MSDQCLMKPFHEQMYYAELTFLRNKPQNSEMLFQMLFMVHRLKHRSSKSYTATTARQAYAGNIGWYLKFRDTSEHQGVVLQTATLTAAHLHSTSRERVEEPKTQEGIKKNKNQNQTPKPQLLHFQNFIESHRILGW